ncbi:bifunctional adenosylcobinamide kinase/adenosylcobinamide-phosphate guanylyltransferase [Candidatus Poribacteria bacterium]|nr:bifunctional adenosylcobinamide kinase/adenosylcobinamide-phosphate guanylyltransferase [Candidatus Poribacteria bacterium]
MSLIFITGGARSGKSRYAVELARKAQMGGGKVAFIATAQAGDDEMAKRIRRHQEERPSEWTTIEEPINVADALRRAVDRGHTLILIDCLTLLISNLTFRPPHESTIPEAREKEILEVVRQIAETANVIEAQVIVISNELGMGIVPDNPLSRRFRDVAGKANQIMAQAAETVYFCVSGIPLLIKGKAGHPNLVERAARPLTSQRLALLFDAGDTLLFPKPSREERFQHIAQQIGLTLPMGAIRDGYQHLDRHLAQHGRPLRREGLDIGSTYNALILEGAGFDGDVVTYAKTITQAFDAPFIPPRACRAGGSPVVEFQVFPETGAVLNRLLRAGYKLGIVSNWDESLEACCAQVGIRHFFDVIVASQVVGVSKPDRRIFEIALQRLGVEPAAAVHIGDSYHTDVIGAHNAGIIPILFDWKGCFPDAESLRIETLNDLRDYVCFGV